MATESTKNKLFQCCGVSIAAGILAVAAVSAATLVYVFAIGVPIIPA